MGLAPSEHPFFSEFSDRCEVPVPIFHSLSAKARRVMRVIE